MSLPPDVLVLIFRSLYDTLHEMKQSYEIGLYHQTLATEDVSWDTRDLAFWRWTEEPVLAPTLFPYACARVCTQWRDIIVDVSAFWTRVVICLDAPYVSASWVRWLLERSRDYPIQVWVTRMSKQPGPALAGGPDDERSRIEMVMEGLAPHLTRCRALCLNVLYRSSVIAACSRLSGEAPALKSLVLNSRITDLTKWNSHIHHLTCNLTHLTIDAKTFIDVRRHRDWAALSDTAPKKLSIRITAYTPSEDPASSVSMHTLVSALRGMLRCESLTIKDVRFSPPDDAENNNPLGAMLRAQTLIFENLEGTAVRDFFANTITQPWRTSITRCSLDGEWPHPLAGRDLTFTEIGADDQATLARVLRDWDGQLLHFVRCPAVDDAFLQETVAGLAALYSLQLAECAFTPNILRAITEQRAAGMGMSRMGSFEVVYPGVALSEELRAWAKDAGVTLLWTTCEPPPGYGYDGYFRGIRPEVYDDEDCFSYLTEE